MLTELMRTYKDCRNISDVYEILNGYAKINNRKLIDTFFQDWIKDCSITTVENNLRLIWDECLSAKFRRIFDRENLKTKPSLLQKIFITY